MNEIRIRMNCHERDAKSTCEGARLSVLVLTGTGNTFYFQFCILLKSNRIFMLLSHFKIFKSVLEYNPLFYIAQILQLQNLQLQNLQNLQLQK